MKTSKFVNTFAALATLAGASTTEIKSASAADLPSTKSHAGGRHAAARDCAGATKTVVSQVMAADSALSTQDPRVISHQDWLTEGKVAGTFVQIESVDVGGCAQGVRAAVQQHEVRTGDSYLDNVWKGVNSLANVGQAVGAVMVGDGAIRYGDAAKQGKLGTNIEVQGSSSNSTVGNVTSSSKSSAKATQSQTQNQTQKQSSVNNNTNVNKNTNKLTNDNKNIINNTVENNIKNNTYNKIDLNKKPKKPCPCGGSNGSAPNDTLSL